MRQNHLIHHVTVLLALYILLAACAAPAAAPPTPAAIETPAIAPAGSTTASSPMTEEELAQRANEMRIATAFAPNSLDPALADPENPTSSMVLRALYQTLVMAPFDPNAAVEPDLAFNWGISEDGLVIHFLLNPEATFASGEAVTADDVVFSIERLKAIGAAPASLAATIDSAETVDDQTVKLTLTQPDPAILDKLASTAFGVLQRSMVEEGTSPDDTSVGSGPYFLQEWIPNQKIVLARNDFYPDEVYPDESDRLPFVVVEILDPETQVERLDSGEIDVALDLPANAQKFLEETFAATVDTTPTLNILYLAVYQKPDTARAISDPLLLQRALMFALDYDGIRKMLGDEILIPSSFLPQQFPEAIERGEPVQDIEQARTLLQEAGYQGEAIPLIFSESSPLSAQLAQKILQDFEDAELINLDRRPLPLPIGIEPTWLQPGIIDDLVGRPGERGGIAILISVARPDYLDASAYLDFLPGGEIAERINFVNEELKMLREKILISDDEDQRTDLLRHAQELANREAPYVFVAQQSAVVGVSPVVTGYQHHQLYTVRVSKLHWELCDDAAKRACAARCRWFCHRLVCNFRCPNG